jgi:hypothetical protein
VKRKPAQELAEEKDKPELTNPAISISKLRESGARKAALRGDVYEK